MRIPPIIPICICCGLIYLGFLFKHVTACILWGILLIGLLICVMFLLFVSFRWLLGFWECDLCLKWFSILTHRNDEYRFYSECTEHYCDKCFENVKSKKSN